MTLIDRARDLYQGIVRYFDAPDPLDRAVNTIALVVASNIPFYPFYILGIADIKAWPAALSYLTLPLFLAVPAAGRRDPRLGRVLLVAAGLIDTALCAKGLGARSSVELYYIPILALPLFLYGSESWAFRSLLAAATLVVFWFGRFLGAPLEDYTPPEYHSLSVRHAISVSFLTGLIVWLRVRFHIGDEKTAA